MIVPGTKHTAWTLPPKGVLLLGNIIGAPIIGNVKDQEDTLERRLEQAVAEE